MKRYSRSIRAKFTLLFIGILCFSCFLSLALIIIAAHNLSVIEAMHKSQEGGIALLVITTALCAAIGSIIMTLASKYISKPIQLISDSTKEVAKGNFDIEIKYKSEDEIGVLAQNFNIMTKELKSMEYLRKDFMSNVSHEFKTPILSIQGFAELLKNKELPIEKFDEYTDIIIEESKRLNNLSSNMLRLSRLDNQTILSKKVCFSLDEQIRKTFVLLEEYWSAKNLDLELNLDKVKYEGDEELILQIWINLIGNAIKFSEEEGTIAVSLKEELKSVKLEIQDEGIGMPEDMQPRIFEKFYKGDTSRSNAGNGLGLAIVKRILELCHGEISFESRVGEGTCFTVILPKE